MKTRLILAMLLTVLATACTTVRPATPTEADAATAYIVAVENAAFGRATKVLWVHPPSNEDLEKPEERKSRW